MSAVRFRLKGSAPPTDNDLRDMVGRPRLYAVSLLSTIPLGLCLVVRTQPDDGEDEEANHHDGYDEHPDESSEQPREVRRFHARFEQQEHGNEIAHARKGCNGRTLTGRNRALAFC